eukprot:641667-Pelagomonas_calceolata.AAC.1
MIYNFRSPWADRVQGSWALGGTAVGPCKQSVGRMEMHSQACACPEVGVQDAHTVILTLQLGRGAGGRACPLLHPLSCFAALRCPLYQILVMKHLRPSLLVGCSAEVFV